MQVKKIQEAIQAYRQHLATERFFQNQYKWEIVQEFQQNWDIEAPKLGSMYDASLQSSHTRRWWKGENFHPKEMMIRFMELSPDFARRVFKDLFNEEKDLEGRISRFQFACEVLLEEYKKANPLTIDNNHFHSDNAMISLYLGLRYPQQYTVIFYDDFSTFLQKIGTRQIPTPYEYERFFKICRALHNFVKKDEELLALHHSKLDLQKNYLPDSLWLIQDLYEWGAKNF